MTDFMPVHGLFKPGLGIVKRYRPEVMAGGKCIGGGEVCALSRLERSSTVEAVVHDFRGDRAIESDGICAAVGVP